MVTHLLYARIAGNAMLMIQQRWTRAMLNQILLAALSQAIANFAARVNPPKYPVTSVISGDILNTTDTTGLYFHVTDTNIPETLDVDETYRPYVVQRNVSGSNITLVAQSLHNGNALYGNTYNGTTWSGWVGTTGDVYSIDTTGGTMLARKL